MAVTIVTRPEWNALFPKSTARMPKPVSMVVIHHSVTPTNADPLVTTRAIQSMHMRDPKVPYTDIAYQRLVAQDGRLIQGRGLDVLGGATVGKNNVSLSWCALGNFETDHPSPALIETLCQDIAQARRDGRLTATFTIVGHRDTYATACPGKWLFAKIPTIRQRVAQILDTPIPPTYPPTRTPEYDMFHHYRLHPGAVNEGEAVDWIIAPNGPKYACPSTGFLNDLKKDPTTYRFHDLSLDKDASVFFRTGVY